MVFQANIGGDYLGREHREKRKEVQGLSSGTLHHYEVGVMRSNQQRQHRKCSEMERKTRKCVILEAR